MIYTEEQKNILKHDCTKHACILAGPGTGKSSTIIEYISKIQKDNPNKKIKLLTFTRAANGELIEKIKTGNEKILSSTIHSYAISVLLNNPGTTDLPKPIRIADDWEWKELLREDIAINIGTNVKIVDKLKNEMSAHWESLSPERDDSLPDEIRHRFIGLWDEHRRLYGYILLAELPYRMKIALEGNVDLNMEGVELICVDEYQDLNACDLSCFRLLAKRDIVIIAIGDDDQSIYKFRKADPKGIQSFASEYNASTYPLTVSHRCGKNILSWANYVIEGDTSRPKKQPLKPGSANISGKVEYLVFKRENKEAEGISRIVKWLVEKEKIPAEEILILMRTGNIGKYLKKVLKDNHISCSDPEETLKIIYGDTGRELLCRLRLIVNKEDSLAWWGLIKLTKGLGPTVIKKISEQAKKEKCTFGSAIKKELENEFKNTLSKSKAVTTCIQELSKKVKVDNLPDKTNWGRWIIEEIKENRLPRITQEMQDILLKIDNVISLETVRLDQYLNQIEPIIKDITNAKTPGQLRIMTLSRSKGLTVRATIIAGAEDGIIPHPIGDRQEERRLLYVGMTRSQEYLYITRSIRRIGITSRSGKPNIAGSRCPCPFLAGGPVRQLDGEQFLEKISN